MLKIITALYFAHVVSLTLGSDIPELRFYGKNGTFCPGETAQLICTWGGIPVGTWFVNGSSMPLSRVGLLPRHSTSTSYRRRQSILSVTQLQSSVTTYKCSGSDDHRYYHSQQASVVFKGTFL